MRKRNIVLLIAAIAVLVLLGLLGWRIVAKLMEAGPGGGKTNAAAVAVDVAPVEHGVSIRDISRFTGTLVARSYVVIAPKIAGKLEKLTVDIGDRVKRGQVIAELDKAEIAEQVRQAEAELDVASANVDDATAALTIARSDFQRTEALAQKEVASKSELEAAEARLKAQEAKLKVAQAQVAQKEAALKSAQVRLSYTTIVAAWDGGAEERVIGERFAEQGAMLSANAPIVSLLDISSMTAVINIIERDYAQINPGQTADITTDAYPDKSFTGRVTRIAPLLKETTRQARVEVELPNPEGLLKPGMFVRAQIEFARHDNATTVPFAALATRNGGRGVFLIDEAAKKAKFVPVTIGITEGERVEILQPPLDGKVVTLGQHLLEDGGAVLLPGVAPGGGEGKAGGAPK